MKFIFKFFIWIIIFNILLSSHFHTMRECKDYIKLKYGDVKCEECSSHKLISLMCCCNYWDWDNISYYWVDCGF